MRRIQVTLHYPTPWLSRREWEKMHSEKKRQLTQAIASQWQRQYEPMRQAMAIAAPLADVKMHMIRVCTRKLDVDNKYGGTKPYLDAMTKRRNNNLYGIGMIEDDTEECVTEFIVTQQKVTKASGEQPRTIVMIDGLVV